MMQLKRIMCNAVVMTNFCSEIISNWRVSCETSSIASGCVEVFLTNSQRNITDTDYFITDA